MSKTIKDIVKNPALLFLTLGHRGYLNWMSDERYLKIGFRISMGKILNLENPSTFCEKIQWLKLYDREPEYIKMVDKCEVKEYVGRIIGKQYIIPTLGVWDSVDEINFDALPDQFVLKCTHDSGGIVICKDKKDLDINNAKRRLRKCMRHNYYWGSREWPYKGVSKRIIAEEYIKEFDNKSTSLVDYKFFCFGGEPKYCQVTTDRFTSRTSDFFDMDWNHQVFNAISSRVSSAKKSLEKPDHFDEMIETARKLSVGLPFVRIDLYNNDGKILFGEITFYPGSGHLYFSPSEYDNILGDMLKLPTKKINRI